MGPSGCGKTTLLDCLAGRKSVGKIIVRPQTMREKGRREGGHVLFFFSFSPGILSLLPQGTVRFSGHAASRTFLRRYTGYVEQADTLVSNLTVAEMLMYSAELKLPVSTSRAAKVDKDGRWVS